MKKKELLELINNYKPKYLYRRKDGGIDKFEVIDENTLVHIQTGVAVRLDETILLGKVVENIIDLIQERRLCEWRKDNLCWWWYFV